jgi:nicotinamide-nucleotide amidase
MQNCLPDILIATAQRVFDANKAAGRRIAVAESCTGGLVSAALTAIAGSSEILEVGFVTYSNEAKISALGVANEIIEMFGAVSSATAWAMAQGALDRSTADVSVAITGIAGPGGGSVEKPVGTVVFARARRGAATDDVVADTKQFGDLGRDAIRLQAALVALELLMPGTEP